MKKNKIIEADYQSYDNHYKHECEVDEIADLRSAWDRHQKRVHNRASNYYSILDFARKYAKNHHLYVDEVFYQISFYYGLCYGKIMSDIHGEF